MVTLRIIYSNLLNTIENILVFNILSRGFDANGLADVMNGFNKYPVNRIIDDVTNKNTIDLDIINGHILQVRKRAEATTKIIQRETAAHLFDMGNEFYCLAHIGYC